MPSSSTTAKSPDDTAAITSTVDRTLIAEIQPGFWVGGLGALKEIRKIRKADPNSSCAWTIVSIVHSPKLSHFCQSAVKEILEQVNTSDKHCEIQRHVEWDMADRTDSALLCERLKEILRVMDESNFLGGYPNQQLLVHCAFGISRSVSVCAAWLMSRQNYNLNQAMSKIRAARHDAQPNMGFLANLRTIEQTGGDIDQALERQERLRKAR
mmetsp:Transcript_59/g.271  ORF Transcript_59/g.271 Transcript_59/m.271 type:complete len:211 (-) Transcript_59:2381-3013(-)